jgi:hypothetical protein
VLKNFPTASDLERALDGTCNAVSVLQLQHYWAVSATLS